MPKRTERRWWEFDRASKAPPDFPTPDCFTEEEWGAYYEAEKQAVWSVKKLKSSIDKDMCGDCTLAFQQRQIKEGKCKPHYGALTPLHRIAMLAAGEEDPLEEEVKSRATPWSELPLLRAGSAGPDPDGSGQEETTGHGDDSLVLSE